MLIEFTEINQIIQQMYAHFHEKNQHILGFKIFIDHVTVYITDYSEEYESFDGCDAISYALPKNIAYSEEELDLINKIIACILSHLHEDAYTLSFIISINTINDEYVIAYKPYFESAFIDTTRLVEIPEREVRVKEYMVKSRQMFLLYARLLMMLRGEYSEKSKEQWQTTLAEYVTKNEKLAKEGHGEIINEYLAKNTAYIDHVKANIAKIDSLNHIKDELEQKMQQLPEKELNSDQIYLKYLLKIS